MNPTRRLIRRVVLATSVPPFLQIYRGAYGIVIGLALRLFKQHPWIKTVYLRRGGARGDIIPLVSDIDFAIIAEDATPAQREDLLRAYAALARTTTLLDRTIEIYDEESFRASYAKNYYHQYRFTEGKTSWRLLSGRDYLSELPALPHAEMYGGFFSELHVWWALFAWRLLQGRRYANEAAPRNAMCYKAVAETVRMLHALNAGRLPSSREEALALARASAGERDRALIDRLQSAARRNFRPRDEGIVEETKDFLMRTLDQFFDGFAGHPLARPLDPRAQVVDYSESDRLADDAALSHARRVFDWIRSRCGDAIRGAFVTPSTYFNVDELLLFLVVSPDNTPRAEDLVALNEVHTTGNPGHRVRLFLLLPHVALQLDTADLTKSWQSTLSPVVNPETFELLGRRAFALEAGDYVPPGPRPWTPLVEHFVLEERGVLYDALRDPAVYKVEDAEFLRLFWKTAQIVVIERSARQGEAVHAMTPARIARALARVAAPLPGALRAFVEARGAAAAGGTSSVSALRPAAIEYLESIAP